MAEPFRDSTGKIIPDDHFENDPRDTVKSHSSGPAPIRNNWTSRRCRDRHRAVSAARRPRRAAAFASSDGAWRPIYVVSVIASVGDGRQRGGRQPNLPIGQTRSEASNLLEANDILRSEPPEFSRPFLRRVAGPIFLRDGALAEELVIGIVLRDLVFERAHGQPITI
jgi:hypothetical protein